MKTIEAKAGQSLLDIAMQYCGDAGCWHAVAKANGVADDWVATGGERIEVDEAEAAGYAALLKREGVEPSTGLDGMEDGIGHEAVGEMMIG